MIDTHLKAKSSVRYYKFRPKTKIDIQLGSTRKDQFTLAHLSSEKVYFSLDGKLKELPTLHAYMVSFLLYMSRLDLKT